MTAKIMYENSFIVQESWILMLEHLSCIKMRPRFILNAGYSSHEELECLKKKFPKATIIGVFDSMKVIEASFKKQFIRRYFFQFFKIFRSLCNPSIILIRSKFASLPFMRQADCICSNLIAHLYRNPGDLLKEWHSVMVEGAALVFSVFGPDTLSEFRKDIFPEMANQKFFNILGWPKMTLFSVQDYGNFLLNADFENPVVDRELLCIEYRDADLLFQDLKNCSFIFHSQLATNIELRKCDSEQFLYERINRYFEKHGTVTLTFELIFGHAFRSTAKKSKRPIL